MEYIGEIDDAEKDEFLGEAFALLLPIGWPEPFGFVMIKAMACALLGLPYRRGSVPEIIEQRRDGFHGTKPERSCPGSPQG